MENSKDEVYLELDFEHLLSCLFGKINYHGTVGNTDRKNWSKNIFKIIDEIEKSILLNINFTDDFQRKNLINICSTTKKKINSSTQVHTVNQHAIIGMTKLMFNLIGQMPDNWNRKVINHSNHRKLTKYRTINYSQNIRQKAELILFLSTNSIYNKDLPPIKELNFKFYSEFANNELKFVNWFKDQYPKNYIKMFLV